MPTGGDHVCSRGKAGSERRAVKMTRLTTADASDLIELVR
jgi:hypothetical protein